MELKSHLQYGSSFLTFIIFWYFMVLVRTQAGNVGLYMSCVNYSSNTVKSNPFICYKGQISSLSWATRQVLYNTTCNCMCVRHKCSQFFKIMYCICNLCHLKVWELRAERIKIVGCLWRTNENRLQKNGLVCWMTVFLQTVPRSFETMWFRLFSLRVHKTGK